MKIVTFKKKIEILMTIEHPVITFKAQKVRVCNGPDSWDSMGYVAYFNGLSRQEYVRLMDMSYDACDKILKDYMKETYKSPIGEGHIDHFVYSAKQLNLPELPKLKDTNYNDDHADLVNMFKGL